MIYCGIKHVFSIWLFVSCLSEVMADSSKDKSSKTEDFTAKDVDDVDLLNVSFSEMELGKNIDVRN